MRTTRVAITMPTAYWITRKAPSGTPEAICVGHVADQDPGVVHMTADLDLPVISPVRLSVSQAREIASALWVAADEAEATERDVFDL